MDEQTPHEQVVLRGGVSRADAEAALHRGLVQKRGQHVYLTVPAKRPVAEIYAWAKGVGVRVLDVTRDGASYLVKVVDSP